MKLTKVKVSSTIRLDAARPAVALKPECQCPIFMQSRYRCRVTVVGWVEPNRLCWVSYLNATYEYQAFMQSWLQRAKPNKS